MPRPKKLTPAQIRDRKAKRLAIVLGVVFLAVLGFQGPTLLKAINGSSGAAAAGADVSAISSASSVASTASASAVSTASAVNGGSTPGAPLPGSGAAVAAGAGGYTPSAEPSGQLSSLNGFGLRDPFFAQAGVTATTTTSGSAAAKPANAAATTSTASTTPAKTPSSSATTTTATTTAATTTAKALPLGGTQSVPFTTAPKPVVPPNAAVLKLNGRRVVVPLEASFPSHQPLFQIVKLMMKKKAIGIVITVVGGSFTSGKPSLELRLGKTFTLANKSDGTKYVVKLMKLTYDAKAPVQTTPATSPASTTTTAGTTTGLLGG